MFGARRRGRGGLSMIEVMIAISVLAFVLLAFLSVIQSQAVLSASSREASVAAFQLHAALEATFAIPFDEFRALYVNDGPKATGPLDDLFPDIQDPDHRPGDDAAEHLHPKDMEYAGHLGSLPNPTTGSPSRLPDFCQTTKGDGKAPNFTWRPTVGWVAGDTLPLRNQHMFIEWTNWDRRNEPVEWIEYRLTLSWTNHKNRTQTDSLITRRSR